MVLDYFSNMFSASNLDLNHMRSVVELIQPRISVEMNSTLCIVYSEMEIKTALFQMYPTKSPGPDGMPPLFFQHYWDSIGSDIVAAVQHFFMSGQMLSSMNFTHVCLIPKVKNPVRMSDLRPIALCNVMYKICAKVIVNRLKKVLPDIISPAQSAFVPGRLIADNTLLANEVSHYIHNKRAGNEGVMSLKLDMSKAYDRIEWCFLEAVLHRLGFDVGWIHIIMQCVTTVRYSFLINGQPHGYITPTRGLRQGDPLSPYLFLLCAEGFSALLEHKVVHGFLHGIRVCPEAPRIHHLLFADDSLLFGSATTEECIHLQSVLRDYELASGQKINLSKSEMVFSKNVPPALCDSLAHSLGVVIVAKHEKYLGLPTFVGRKKIETFGYIKERLSKKLEGWQGKILSGAGKDLLIRVVAQSLPSYAMSCFLLTKMFCDSLHQLCAKFWWGSRPENRKIHWMSWERLCLPKEEGGMGFRDLYAHNLALLAKQAWRLMKFPNSLLARVYRAKYYPSGDLLSSFLTPSPSSCWRGIFESITILWKGLRWQIGDGRRVNIWTNPWIPRPFSFRPIIRRSAALNMFHELFLPGGGWNEPLILTSFDQEDADLILSIPLGRRSSSDRLIWHFDSRGCFSVKSAYKLAFDKVYNVVNA